MEIYVVRQGDTIDTIAREQGADVWTATNYLNFAGKDLHPRKSYATM